MKSHKDSLLLIGMSTPMALQVVRSLGSNGVKVYGVAGKRSDIANYSRYLHKFLVLPGDIYQHMGRIVEYIKKNEINYVIALGEVQICALNEYRVELEKHAMLLFPEDSKMQLVLDKSKTLDLAGSLGLEVPKSLLVDNKDDLGKITSIPLPLIIKPSFRSFRSAEKRKSDFRIKYYSSYDKAGEFLRECINMDYPCLVQERLSGEETCVAFLRYHKRIIAHCQFNFAALSDVPGIPSIKESAATLPELYEYGRHMLDTLDWEGVALFDFIKNQSSARFALLEINGRFWGSTTLCSRAGVDFPHLLYQAASGKSNDQRVVTPVPGVRVRNLCGVTRMYFEGIMKNRSLSFFIKSSGEYIKPFFKSGQQEVQLLKDPVPGLVDICNAFAELVGKFRRQGH